MKRLTALAAALLVAVASGCTTTTTTNTNTGAGNSNANANAAATAATPAGPTQADIEAKERQSWEALKAKNWDAFAATLADDFVYVGEDGAADRAQTIEGVKKLDLTEYTLSDFRFVRVDADLAVVTYTSVDKSTYDGKPGPGKPVRNSSAWVSRGGRWLTVYHQETEVAEAPAGQETAATPAASPAATSASPGASPGTSPAASPGASPASPATATDAEKAVWDAVKRRDAEAFSNFLAAESLEVEPDGVYDKAAAARAVSGFDASKFTQSGFKETKLDADATLVTYSLTGTDPRGQPSEMFHSTIWTNRGGQWKAVLHQGTYASKGGGM